MCHACRSSEPSPGGSDLQLGGRSSAWLERQVVALEVGGSSPLGHPQSSLSLARPHLMPGTSTPRPRLVSRDRRGVTPRVLPHQHHYLGPYLSADIPDAPRARMLRLSRASSSIWQSNGLLIRRFWVRVPGGAPGGLHERPAFSSPKAAQRILPRRCIAASVPAPGSILRFALPFGAQDPRRADGRGGQGDVVQLIFAGPRSVVPAAGCATSAARVVR
jgi:hypothetical protein